MLRLLAFRRGTRYSYDAAYRTMCSVPDVQERRDSDGELCGAMGALGIAGGDIPLPRGMAFTKKGNKRNSQ